MHVCHFSLSGFMCCIYFANTQPARFVCKTEMCFCFVGKPLIISCAYSGRFAVAYRHGNVRRRLDNPNDKAVNLYVAIYECESSGGLKQET